MPHVDFPQSRCRAGVARRDITPPVGIYHRMWGAATHEQATGVHRPLTATALALAPRDGNVASASSPTPAGPQVLVGIDHCLLWREEMDALRARVARDAQLSLNQVHIAFSHTHAAGLMDPARADRPGGQLIAPYLEHLADEVGRAAGEALRALAPANIVYGTGRCGLARNRDFWDAQSKQFVCGLNPAGLTDDTVLVARITRDDSHTIATVVNYACHPTTLAWDNTLISPDYVGAMREVVEQATAAPCLFLQGASGDLGPRVGYVGDVEVADRNGRELGYAALAALESLVAPNVRLQYTGAVVSGATIGTWDYQPLDEAAHRVKERWRVEHFSVPLKLRSDLASRADVEQALDEYRFEMAAALRQGNAQRARDFSAQAERMQRQLSRLRALDAGGGLSLAVTLLALGDAAWVLVAAEHYHLLQRALREQFPRTPVVVATLTDGWVPGYLPTAETYGKGIYQESIALAAPGSLEKVIGTITENLGRWFE